MTQGLTESPDGGQGERTPLAKAKENLFNEIKRLQPHLASRMGDITNMTDAERILLDIRYDDETLELNLKLDVLLDYMEHTVSAPHGTDTHEESDTAGLGGENLKAALLAITWEQRRAVAEHIRDVIGIGPLVIHMERMKRYDATDILEQNLRDLYQRILNPA